ncbi:MAG TPA: cation:proton antiporter [Methylomirabilota bacterium]|nr:cation:proton antiporter [Methylomirabilota bacterium]
MISEPGLFRDLAYVFLAAVVGGALARYARQPLILGYVLGGLLISPLTPGPSVADVHTFERFAEIGVILLMFSLGIEFSLKDLAGVKWIAILGGPLGILMIIGLAMAVGAQAGWSPTRSAVVGMVVSVASTMVLARLLLDRGEIHSRHGRILIGISLVEDLIVVVLIVLIPALGALQDRIVAIARALVTAAVILIPFFYLTRRILPPLLARVARTRSDELFLLVALAIGLGAAALTQAAGLSLALGAFLAGLLINESDYAHEMLARLLSLRDAFVALFFVTVGVLIDPRVISTNLGLLMVLVGIIVIGNWAIWTIVALIFRQPLSTALLVGVGLTQIGEFSFVLVQVARQAGHVGLDVYNATLAASLVTILLNAVLVRVVPGWIGPGRLDESTLTWGLRSAGALEGHVVLCGFGRVGSAIGEALETFGIPYVAIETDPDIVKSLRARNVPAVFGDSAQRVILAAAQTDRAALVILAIPESDRARLAVGRIRALNPDAPILARVLDSEWRARLMEAGAAEVIQPEEEAASTLIRHALERLALPRDRVLAYLSRFRTAMEHAEAAAADAGTGLPLIREVRLKGGSPVGRPLGETRMRERFGVMLVRVTRHNGEVVLQPTAETVLRAGDRLRLFGLPRQIDAMLAATDLLIE